MVESKKAFIAFCMVMALPALAAAAPQRGMQPCKEDQAKHCADVKAGQGRIMACLAEHSADLSAECKQMIEQRKQQAARGAEQAKAFRAACGDDVDKLCSSEKGKRRAVLLCLADHQDLSASCKEGFGERLQQIKAGSAKAPAAAKQPPAAQEAK